MVDYIIGVVEGKKLESIYAVTLRDDIRMIKIFEKLGFHIDYQGSEAKATLKLR